MRFINTKITEVRLKNFKNTEAGTLTVITDIDKRKGSILGIYGQNGSGKTAIIDSLQFIQMFVFGKSNIGKIVYPYIMSGKKDMSIAVDILCELENGIRYDICYELIFVVEDDTANISKEIVTYKKYENEEWTRRRTLIECDGSDIKPKTRKSEIKTLFFENSIKMHVLMGIMFENNKSFIFSDDFMEKIHNKDCCPEEYEIIVDLKEYFESYLCVISNVNGGLIDANLYMPVFCAKKCGDIHKGYIIAMINLIKPTKIDAELYLDLVESIEKSNKVLSEIVPGLTVELYKSRTLYENDEEQVEVELISVRDGVRTHMQYESEGIKKIIAIIHLLIFAYSNKNATIAIDEFDAGVFEYLLGEILGVMEDTMKGQFIFTSHNLRPLEVLDKNNIVVTTTNPKNRYIRMKNIPTSNNLRNFYYRDIELDGQDEEIYKPTSRGRLRHSLYKVGDLNE